MSVFRLTEDGDLYRPDGATSFERVGGVEQVRQHLRTRMRLFTREVFRDTRIGVQYFEIVMQRGFSPGAVANHLASVALATPGVVDCELTYDVEPVRGVVNVFMDVAYIPDDLKLRAPIHETMQISIGGSIQT